MSIISDIVSGVISPVTSMVSSMFNKKEDATIEKFKVDGKVDLSLLNAYTEQLKARANLTRALMDSWIGKTLYLGFEGSLMLWWIDVIAYCMLHPYFPQIKPVLALPDNLNPWAFAMISFLFLSSKIDGWVRKT